MTRNVGSADRVVRVLVGLALIGFGIANKAWWGAIGIVPLGTALLGWCPLYVPFGLSSCATKK